ncbi:MAG: thioredoxin domain-containing protein [Gaiellaceae bacterium]
MHGNVLPHLLFFTSLRSGPGRRMESLLAQLERRERDRLRITRVDAEASPKLSECLDISEVPALVLLVDKRPVGRIDGRASAPEIERLLACHLVRGNPEGSLAA